MLVILCRSDFQSSAKEIDDQHPPLPNLAHPPPEVYMALYQTVLCKHDGPISLT